jgi:cytochrome c oxidase subunit I
VFLALAGAILFTIDFFRSIRNGQKAGNDPWDARTLEWSVSSPPPEHDFDHLPHVTGIDAFWLQKHPEFDHSDPAEKTAMAKEAQDADTHGIHIPGQSWYPLVASLAMFIGGYAVIYHNWFLGILCFFLIVAASYGWAFEGVGGKHIHPKGHHS